MTEVTSLPYNARILIVLMGSLGDVIRGLSVVTSLRRALPACHITWLVEPKSRGIPPLHKGIDEVLVFDRKHPVMGALATIRALRERRFDVVLDLQRHLKSGIFSLLSGSQRRIGFHRRNAKEGNHFFSTETIEYYSDELPKLEHYLKFVEHLGFGASVTTDSGLEGRSTEGLKEKFSLSGSHFVGVVMGTSWESKDWLLPGYVGLGEGLLRQKGVSLLLLGDKSQGEAAEKVRSALDGDRVYALAGRTTLEELVSLIKICSVCVGPDSGPGHIAAAVKTPYVGLFGPTAPRRVAPYGFEHLAIVAPVGCSPCLRKECPGLDRLCMRLISPEMVLQRVLPLLENPSRVGG